MAQRTIDLTSDIFASQGEAVANGAITPGMLIIKQSTGKVIANTVAGEKILSRVAVENVLFGKEIDTAYASGDRVFYKTFPRGSRIYMLVAGSAAAIVIGDKLVAGAAGTVKIATSATATSGGDEEHVMFKAATAVDNSTETGTARIEVIVV